MSELLLGSHKKIILTIEEKFGGTVEVKSDPSVEMIGKMLKAGYDVPSFYYAATAIKAMLDLNQKIIRKQNPSTDIII